MKKKKSLSIVPEATCIHNFQMNHYNSKTDTSNYRNMHWYIEMYLTVEVLFRLNVTYIRSLAYISSFIASSVGKITG